MAALLHDVLDDTEAEYSQVEEAFGEQVRAGHACCWRAGGLGCGGGLDGTPALAPSLLPCGWLAPMAPSTS